MAGGERRDHPAARASFGLQPSQNPRITFASSSCFLQQHLERARERSGRQQTIGVCVCECVLGERKGRLCAEKSTGELIENFQAFPSLSLPSPHTIAVLEYSLTLLSTPQTNTLKIHSLSPYAFAFAAPKLHYCLFAFVSSY